MYMNVLRILKTYSVQLLRKGLSPSRQAPVMSRSPKADRSCNYYQTTCDALMPAAACLLKLGVRKYGSSSSKKRESCITLKMHIEFSSDARCQPALFFTRVLCTQQLLSYYMNHTIIISKVVCTQVNNEEMTCEEMAFFSHGFLKQYHKSSKDSATIFSKFSLFGETIF